MYSQLYSSFLKFHTKFLLSVLTKHEYAELFLCPGEYIYFFLPQQQILKIYVAEELYFWGIRLLDDLIIGPWAGLTCRPDNWTMVLQKTSLILKIYAHDVWSSNLVSD